MVLKIKSGTGDFEEYSIDKDEVNWSQGIMNIIENLKTDE